MITETTTVYLSVNRDGALVLTRHRHWAETFAYPVPIEIDVRDLDLLAREADRIEQSPAIANRQPRRVKV